MWIQIFEILIWPKGSAYLSFDLQKLLDNSFKIKYTNIYTFHITQVQLNVKMKINETVIKIKFNEKRKSKWRKINNDKSWMHHLHCVLFGLSLMMSNKVAKLQVIFGKHNISDDNYYVHANSVLKKLLAFNPILQFFNGLFCVFFLC